MAYPGRCLSLRLVLMLVPLVRVALAPTALVPAALVPAVALALTALGTIHVWDARARGVLWFGRMR
jgi:hypothetical protein